MTAAELIAALELPAGAFVDQRVPKKTLAEHGATTASARKQIQDGVEELRWVAALKPTTSGVPVYRDGVREYLEIAVLHLRMRPEAKPTQLVPLVHRAIPYPVVLVASGEGLIAVSLAHKRWSQGERDQVVLDGDVVEARVTPEDTGERLRSFCSHLALAQQPRNTLYDLYQGWLDTLLAMQTARVLGDLTLPRSREHAEARREALLECARLESEMTSLRAAAAREKQLPRQVEINLQLKRLADAHAAARARL